MNMNTRIIFFIVLNIFLLGCSLDATLISGMSAVPDAHPDIVAHGNSGLSYGERVITTAGTADYELIGAFGEVPEKTSSLNNNNWVIEGTFYE